MADFRSCPCSYALYEVFGLYGRDVIGIVQDYIHYLDNEAFALSLKSMILSGYRVVAAESDVQPRLMNEFMREFNESAEAKSSYILIHIHHEPWDGYKSISMSIRMRYKGKSYFYTSHYSMEIMSTLYLYDSQWKTPEERQQLHLFPELLKERRLELLNKCKKSNMPFLNMGSVINHIPKMVDLAFNYALILFHETRIQDGLWGLIHEYKK